MCRRRGLPRSPATAIMQCNHWHGGSFGDRYFKHPVIFIVAKRLYCAGLQTGDYKRNGITMSDHQDVAASGVQQVLDQRIGVFGGKNGWRKFQKFGQRRSCLLRAFYVRHINLLDACILQRSRQAVCPLLSLRTQQGIGGGRSFLGVTHQKNGANVLLRGSQLA